MAAALDDALGARGALLATWEAADTQPALSSVSTLGDTAEREAVELARRITASDLGGETLPRLEAAVDDIATAYPASAPADLLGPVRSHLNYLRRLIDAHATLDQRRRLLVVGGWLSLLDAMVAVWDGGPSGGHGGTGDVAYTARERGIPVIVVWPEGAARARD